MVRLCFVFLFVCSSLLAESVIQFDVPSTVIATDVTTPEFVATYPGEKLIQISIPISTLVQTTDERALLQCLFLVSGSTTTPFQIEDYAPRTILATDVEGLVVTERSNENSNSIGLNASAPRDFPVPTSAQAKMSTGTRVSERLSRLPEKQLVSASGTMHRGVSAYFKLKPSTQTTLEGAKTFEIMARVPDSWRAGLLYVNCAASAKSQSARQGFVVGASLSGDSEARQLVHNLATSQDVLRHLANRHAGSIHERRYPSMGHRIGGALAMVKPKIPDHWLNKLLTSNDYHTFEKHLPQEIQHAATAYRQARQQVVELAGQS